MLPFPPPGSCSYVHYAIFHPAKIFHYMVTSNMTIPSLIYDLYRQLSIKLVRIFTMHTNRTRKKTVTVTQHMQLFEYIPLGHF